jgi:pimeloyl-ACP methyl ester carboxylesterase
MLPLQYTNHSASRSRSSSNSRGSATSSSRPPSSHSATRAPPPPLGITGVLCQSRTVDVPGRGTLHCTIYRPRMLHSSVTAPALHRPDCATTTTTATAVLAKIPRPRPPLVCVSGGPGMPCQYLSSLVHMVADRAVILYDHLGCGQSSRNHAIAQNYSNEPKETTGSYLNDTVRDLAILIETILPVDSSYHLFGHSLGGIIAYQYLQIPQRPTTRPPRQCLSFVMASTPTSIAASHASSQALLKEIYSEMQPSTSDEPNAASGLDDAKGNNARDNTDDDDDDDDDESGASSVRRAARSEFQLRHECRTTPMPLPLQQSMEGLQRQASQHDVASQQRELQSYVAEPWSPDAPPPPPLLIMRGQHDFITEENMRRWTVLLAEHNCIQSATTSASTRPIRVAPSSQFVTLANCSHYSMAENEDLFGSVLISFLHDHDNGYGT